ncbi:hypothetical protein IEO70_03610 [Bacillus sp. AGMB 02131]|uniref:Uncharacterized protein n=1 Tax=Peribacillus faecalis TaxID=2772559 RepID=A0A927CVC9_9BACI|nr:hypothetical protein [Peribacillus faecalis]MBD3107442.1 hypothetical protein [Peribacillus faecalis]
MRVTATLLQDVALLVAVPYLRAAFAFRFPHVSFFIEAKSSSIFDEKDR